MIYGADGRTPILSESEIKDETRALLTESFGFVSGLLIARATSPEQVETLMNEFRQKIIVGVLAIEGCQKAIEERFDVVIGTTPDGQLVVRPKEAFTRPPGPPRAAGDIYR